MSHPPVNFTFVNSGFFGQLQKLDREGIVGRNEDSHPLSSCTHYPAHSKALLEK